jgi:hypothetical protein
VERNSDIARNLVVAGLVTLLMAGFVLAYTLLVPARTLAQMGGGMAGNAQAPMVPPVTGFSEGEEILFLHTEASDAEIARTLSEMMGSPVLLVPSLAEAPESMLARVYVFTNGTAGMGPLGFQPDVFDSPPMSDDYSPLREVHLVTWRDEASARELRSAGEVIEAEERGELSIERAGVVVNMPMVTWPGGRR